MKITDGGYVAAAAAAGSPKLGGVDPRTVGPDPAGLVGPITTGELALAIFSRQCKLRTYIKGHYKY